MHFTALLFISFILAFGSNAVASEKAEKQKQLTQLKTKIEKLRKTIEVKENSRSSYNRQLRKIEKQIGSISNKIRKSSQLIKTRQGELSKLGKNKKRILKDISTHNRQLSKQLHTAYTLGDQEQVKLLFSQQNAENLQRNLIYYKYFSNFRLQQIEASTEHFNRLINNENKIKLAKKELEKVLKKQQAQKSSLSSDRTKRKKIVLNLEKQLKKQGKFLTRLEDDEKNLTLLIDSLPEIFIQTKRAQSTNKFSSLKGKLSWPVKGKVRKLYGRPKPPSNLRWQGVIIQAKRGNNVRAISHGRVAFSDWLRGMGNLIIIDHGDGYLSLYGHNESLYKVTGEWVEAGDIIGSIGNSGGQSKNGVYFEIRKKSKPQNPTRWCKTRNWFSSI
ncbi:MAG: peptidoglycan DD-metalloendopeptidase family protein [Gammaproteobacteria bacterium]|nr:peptidoglycan DD-metalloendopeptidase family protein [Gammaproteobacteria bacterium]